MKKFLFLLTALSVTTGYGTSAQTAPADGNVYSLTEGTKTDYHFKILEKDNNGNTADKYYKFNFHPEKFTAAPEISWRNPDSEPQDQTNLLTIRMPQDKNHYFQYAYTPKTGLTVYNTPQTKLSGDVTADFAASRAQDHGGAINNAAFQTIGNNTQTHVPYPDVSDVKSNSNGGAIYSTADTADTHIGNITGNFVGNHVINPMNYSYGGAIFNASARNYLTYIGDIKGNFIGNYLSSQRNTHGGAIYNSGGRIGNITGDFIGNYAWTRDLNAQGGAINNSKDINNYAVIGDITGNFIGNFVRSDNDYSIAGAIENRGTMGVVTGDFIGNHSEAYHLDGQGGAMWNDGTLAGIRGDFIGNYAIGDYDAAHTQGGALLNSGSIGFIYSSFLNNYTLTRNAQTGYSYGGAVSTSKALTFSTGGTDRFFSENYTEDEIRGKNYNALFISTYNLEKPTEVTFDTSGGGNWIVNDNIDGGNTLTRPLYSRHYNLTFSGDSPLDLENGTTAQYIAVNNDIINAGSVKVQNTTLRFDTYRHPDQSAKNWDGRGAFAASLNSDGTPNREADAVTSLYLKNAAFYIANRHIETIKLKNYSSDNGFVHIDVDPDAMTADVLDVNGNVEGTTKLIVHAASATDIRNRGAILFARSANDSAGNADSFVISRVYKSPYLYDIMFDRQRDAGNQNHTWEFAMNDTPNPDKNTDPEIPDVPTPPDPVIPVIPTPAPPPVPDNRRVTPEVIAYQGLPTAALEQTRNLVSNIAVSVINADYNLWANGIYNTSKYDSPLKIDADVWGIEAGGDLQHDLNNKLGLFLSYRKGNYDMNGKGKYYYSTVGSEIDIDSYLAGLYYRYDRNNWWTFATVYGGMQKADIKTKDGIKSDTDGTEFGGSVELGYDYAINKTVYLTPSVGAFYTQVDYDDATDSAGKRAVYDDPRQLELEAGVKLTKTFVMDEGYANLYLKPGIVQRIINGDEVKISNLNKIDTMEDQTLGRVELGGRYGFTDQLSAYVWANHTFGDDYKASSFGLELNYAW